MGEDDGAEEGGGAEVVRYCTSNCLARLSAVESVQKTASKVTVFCHLVTGISILAVNSNGNYLLSLRPSNTGVKPHVT